MELTIRQRSQKVAECIKNNVHQSLQGIAAATGLSKSSVYRHQQGIERRAQYPESSLWESELGYRYLVRLVLGVIYCFGIKRSVGAESLSEFFHLVHLDTHVASSPSALRGLKNRVNQAILGYGESQAEDCQPKEGQGICVGADETFFGLPVRVLLELASGFIFTEIECENRTYDTWLKQLEQWWTGSGWHCHYLVSDGARALVKLAVSGLGCINVADLFHALRALTRPIGSALGRQLSQLSKQHADLQQQLSKTTDDSKSQKLQARLESTQKIQQSLEQDQRNYQEILETLSTTIHPFTLDTHQWQRGKQLSAHLETPLKSLELLAQSYGGDKAQTAIDTFQSQIDTFAQGIEAWRQWVRQALQVETPERGIQEWVLMSLLPWSYWLQQADKTRQPSLKRRYQQAASTAYDLLLDHPITCQLEVAELEQWFDWCQSFCAKYQRTSSAVEGRNGYLSQLHHAGRGFSEQSLKVLTIIHNFDLKRPDGTTAAQRLFGHSFPDLFESILGHVGDLPMPRRSAKAQ